jgi:hypothetical protein
LVGVAVKVTFVPPQTVVPVLGETVTAGVTMAFTVIVTELLETAGTAHEILLVIWQLTTFPFDKVALV